MNIIGRRFLLTALFLAVPLFHGPATCAATITDASFFSSIPHTLITFEQRGDGSPTPTNNSTPLPLNEYTSSGFTFSPGLSPEVRFVNDDHPASDAAQMIGGSPPIAIAASDNEGDFYINFSSPSIRSFGFWVQHNNTRLGVPRFEAIGASGLIETVFFAGSAIDGSIDDVDYGFLGITTSEPIQRIHVAGDIAALDSFRFSSVAEPMSSGLLALGAAGLLFGRRRMSAPLCGRPRVIKVG